MPLTWPNRSTTDRLPPIRTAVPAREEERLIASDVTRPLVVDLDGCLIETDLLVESASALLATEPLSAPRVFASLRSGKTALKAELAARVDLDVSVLPYREDLLTWLGLERANGRHLVLATASDSRLVRRVAEHLNLFDEVHGSTPEVNLKGAAKRDLLVERFGEGGFDYVGDSRADEVIFASAGTAHRVRPSGGRMRAFVKALRPHQWAKNALVAVPLLTAQRVHDMSAVVATVLAVLSFSLAASSMYVLNDLADVESDRHHPTKRRRPFASGQLSLLLGWAAWPVVCLAAVAIAVAFLPSMFVAVLGVYLAVTLIYTFWAKRKAVLDIVALGGLYTLRIVAGAAAIAAALSMWLLTFSVLFFVSLASIKRVSELARLRREQGVRARGRPYLVDDFELLSSYGVATSIGAVVVFALYVNDPRTAELYQTPEFLWLGVPVLLAWLMRAWLWSHRGEMNEDPILFAIRDKESLLAVGAIAAAFIAANFITR